MQHSSQGQLNVRAMLVVKRRNCSSFESASRLLFQSQKLPVVPLYWTLRGRQTPARFCKYSETSNCCAIIENTSQLRVNCFISVLLHVPGSKHFPGGYELQPALCTLFLDVLQQARACKAKRCASVCAIYRAHSSGSISRSRLQTLCGFNMALYSGVVRWPLWQVPACVSLLLILLLFSFCFFRAFFNPRQELSSPC